ncbi:MAG: nicotinate (nicotinamide) nucleotide adenylyltransferase [Ruminococcus sp.]
MKLGLFGGSFNPIHLGHYKLVTDVIEEFNLDKVIIMPTWKTPLKDTSNFVSPEHRFKMCQLAFENLSSVEVSDLEMQRKGNSYTYLTLNSIKEIYPRDELFLIVGADMFLSLEKWKCFEDIFKTASIIAVPRKGTKENLISHSIYLKEKYDCISYVMSHSVMDVSSTEIRSKIKNAEDVSDLVDTRVFNYIKKKHLYGI